MNKTVDSFYADPNRCYLSTIWLVEDRRATTLKRRSHESLHEGCLFNKDPEIQWGAHVCSHVSVCTGVVCVCRRKGQWGQHWHAIIWAHGAAEARPRGVAFPPASSTVMTCLSMLSPWLHLCQYAETTPFTDRQQTIEDGCPSLRSQSWTKPSR